MAAPFVVAATAEKRIIKRTNRPEKNKIVIYTLYTNFLKRNSFIYRQCVQQCDFPLQKVYFSQDFFFFQFFSAVTVIVGDGVLLSLSGRRSCGKCCSDRLEKQISNELITRLNKSDSK